MKGTLLRGASRRVVVVKNPGSKLFEEAHFILREEPIAPPLPDLLEEANRIVEESRLPKAGRRKKGRGGQFVAGLLTGAVIEALGLAVYLLLS